VSFLLNKFIRQLLYYDFVIQFSFGLLSPLLGVFVISNIADANLEVIGTAVSVYWIARVIFSVPLSKFMDKFDGERDEYYFLLTGTFISSTIPLFFLFATESWHIYVLQFIFGFSNSMLVPAWRILFTDHLDKGKIGLEWSLNDVFVGISIAGSGFFGALIAQHLGFNFLFVFVAICGYVSTLLLIPLYRDALSKPKMAQKLPRPLNEVLHERKKISVIKGA